MKAAFRTFSKSIATIVVGLVVGLAALSVANAYNLLPYWWSNVTNLRACVQSGANTSTYSNQALSDWNATATDFGYVGDCSTPQITFNEVSLSPVPLDGWTTSYNSGSTYVKAEISLNWVHIQYYAPGAAQSVATHELGHGLGLNEVYGIYAVMNSGTCGTNSRWCWFGVETPVGDDIQGMNARY